MLRGPYQHPAAASDEARGKQPRFKSNRPRASRLSGKDFGPTLFVEMPRKRVTAGELLRQLEADPEWVAARQERERKLEAAAATWRADESGLVAELQAAGYSVTTVWDLVNNSPHLVLERPFVGPYVSAYPILVRHLHERHLARVREGIVRALTVSDGGRLVTDALLREFNHEADPDLRWVLANALRKAMPYSLRRKHPEISHVLQHYHGPSGAGQHGAAADDRPQAGDRG